MASRLLLAALSPLFLALAILLYFALTLPSRPKRLLAALAAFLLFLASTGLPTTPLIQSLENRFPSLTPANAPSAQAIVVLGGGLAHANNITGELQLGSHVERLWMAANLYRAGKAPFILVSGGNLVPTVAGNHPESALAADVLRAWGLPPAAIVTEEASQDTHQNAVYSQRLLAARHLDRILLVTSALHMPRAYATFRRTGLAVIPVPTDRLDPSDIWNPLFNLLPESGELYESGAAAKEWIGLALYKFRGWSI